MHPPTSGFVFSSLSSGVFPKLYESAAEPRTLKMARLFVAIEVPDSVRERIFEATQGVEFPGLRWSKPDNYHLTLAFLGEADPEPVIAALNQIAPSGGEIEVFVRGWGAFPRDTSARVLWAGVQAEGLAELAALVKAACQPVAPEMDSAEFKPHLTLARSKQNLRLTHSVSIIGSDVEAISRLPIEELLTGPFPGVVISEKGLRLDIPALDWIATTYSLIESSLNPRGATYTRLAEFRI